VSEPEAKPERHEVALWAGLTALFTNLSGLVIIDAVHTTMAIRAVGVLITSLIIGATVYSKQRWDDAKRKDKEAHDAHQQQT
jgi:hypothetical protein